jgi:oligoribonuclease NrnB/cAMP/cGMP phosphodiesterase (DHH superfamily)
MNKKHYRLLTRSDLDGLICAVLLKHLKIVDEIVLIDHPSVMQEGGIEVTENDIIANLPYIPGVYLSFDHHVSETFRNQDQSRLVINPDAPSAARVIYEYYGGDSRFPEHFREIMEAVDKADSGQFSKDEILDPKGWALLNFLVDKRTGIEDWCEFDITGEQFKRSLIDWIAKLPIDEVLKLPDARQRAEVYFRYAEKYKQQLLTSAVVKNNIVLLDCRGRNKRYPGNRFIIYALYPECNISVQVKKDQDSEKTTFSVGKSIINNTSKVNIGKLMLKYGGGGHRAAGACHVPEADADRVLGEILKALTDPK